MIFEFPSRNNQVVFEMAWDIFNCEGGEVEVIYNIGKRLNASNISETRWDITSHVSGVV